MDDRCDGKTDCQDKSDEEECRVVEMSQSYNKYLSPLPPNAEGEDPGKLPIYSSMAVHLLSSFDSITGSYRAEFTLELKWYDDRLSFNNLRSSPKVNQIQPEEEARLWFPAFVFENTKQKIPGLVDGKSSLKVVKGGAGYISGSTAVENKLVFSGKDNFIVYERFYSEVFDCSFHLHWYPFDTQVCYLDVEPDAELQDFVQFITGDFKYEGPEDLTEYTVKTISMKVEEEVTLRVEVSIQRRLLSLILRTFIPTVILNIIGHMSNYYKETFFVGLMTLNVTVTLVLTTMFLSISTNLPPTAYIKMIDVWLLFNLLKPFVDIIVNTYIENQRGKRAESSKKEAWSAGKPKLGQEVAGGPGQAPTVQQCRYFLRVVYPAFYVLFVVFFWIIGLIKYYSS